MSYIENKSGYNKHSASLPRMLKMNGFDAREAMENHKMNDDMVALFHSNTQTETKKLSNLRAQILSYEEISRRNSEKYMRNGEMINRAIEKLNNDIDVIEEMVNSDTNKVENIESKMDEFQAKIKTIIDKPSNRLESFFQTLKNSKEIKIDEQSNKLNIRSASEFQRGELSQTKRGIEKSIQQQWQKMKDSTDYISSLEMLLLDAQKRKKLFASMQPNTQNVAKTSVNLEEMRNIVFSEFPSNKEDILNQMQRSVEDSFGTLQSYFERANSDLDDLNQEMKANWKDQTGFEEHLNRLQDQQKELDSAIKFSQVEFSKKVNDLKNKYDESKKKFNEKIIKFKSVLLSKTKNIVRTNRNKISVIPQIASEHFEKFSKIASKVSTVLMSPQDSIEKSMKIQDIIKSVPDRITTLAKNLVWCKNVITSWKKYGFEFKIINIHQIGQIESDLKSIMLILDLKERKIPPLMNEFENTPLPGVPPTVKGIEYVQIEKPKFDFTSLKMDVITSKEIDNRAKELYEEEEEEDDEEEDTSTKQITKAQSVPPSKIIEASPEKTKRRAKKVETNLDLDMAENEPESQASLDSENQQQNTRRKKKKAANSNIEEMDDSSKVKNIQNEDEKETESKALNQAKTKRRSRKNLDSVNTDLEASLTRPQTSALENPVPKIENLPNDDTIEGKKRRRKPQSQLAEMKTEITEPNNKEPVPSKKQEPQPTKEPVAKPPEPSKKEPAPSKKQEPQPTKEPVAKPPEPSKKEPAPSKKQEPQPTKEPVAKPPEPSKKEPAPSKKQEPQPTKEPSTKQTEQPKGTVNNIAKIEPPKVQNEGNTSENDTQRKKKRHHKDENIEQPKEAPSNPPESETPARKHRRKE